MDTLSPSPPQDRAQPPSVPPPPPANPLSSTSRRLPPPCWSHDETVALIDSYRDKWYALRRGNLKATHWQEVADAVYGRCPGASLPKTSVQCRHKMEKLRKRYRTELQRTLAAPNRHRKPPSSSWVHFGRMHSMEKGPTAAAVDSGSDAADEEEDEDDDNENNNEEEEEEDEEMEEDLYGDGGKKQGFPFNRGVGSATSNGIGGRSQFRIKLPGDPSSAAGIRGRSHANPSASPDFGSVIPRGARGGKRRDPDRAGGAVAEMVEAVKVLGDGFVKMEKMKMEMAREMEEMRMEMEMKRTEMILASQQKIVEAFAKGLGERKKKAKPEP